MIETRDLQQTSRERLGCYRGFDLGSDEAKAVVDAKVAHDVAVVEEQSSSPD